MKQSLGRNYAYSVSHGLAQIFERVAQLKSVILRKN